MEREVREKERDDKGLDSELRNITVWPPISLSPSNLTLHLHNAILWTREDLGLALAAHSAKQTTRRCPSTRGTAPHSPLGPTRGPRNGLNAKAKVRDWQARS